MKRSQSWQKKCLQLGQRKITLPSLRRDVRHPLHLHKAEEVEASSTLSSSSSSAVSTSKGGGGGGGDEGAEGEFEVVFAGWERGGEEGGGGGGGLEGISSSSSLLVARCSTSGCDCGCGSADEVSRTTSFVAEEVGRGWR